MEEKREEEQGLGAYLHALLGKWFGLFIIVIIAIIFNMMVGHMNKILGGVARLFSILKPIIYGCVIAYLLNPLMKFFQELVLRAFNKQGQEQSKKVKRLARAAGIVLSIFFALLVITVLIMLVLPQLVTTISALANDMPSQVDLWYHNVKDYIENNHRFASKVQTLALNITSQMDQWIRKDLFPWVKSYLLPNVNSIAAMFADGLLNVIGVVYNLFIGLIVAIYILSSKEQFSAQAQKLSYGLMRKKTVDVILHYVRLSNEMFTGFITGKIVDSTIIGIICFVFMLIFRFPYAMLISVIIGVTNIIPVFGPYIGVVPSALLILLANPWQCVTFVIFIIILQQIDGNIIGPAILGGSTGLSAFWVLFSILFFGGLWGIVGMLVGVPLFAVIYTIIKDFVENRLRKKHLETNTLAYVHLKRIDEVNGMNRKYHYVFYTKEERSGSSRKKGKKIKKAVAAKKEMRVTKSAALKKDNQNDRK